MFDIGFTELVLLAGLGLIVLGPQRLPKVAAQLGRWVGQARRMSRTLMYQLRQEVDLDDPRPFSARRPAEASAGTKPKASQEGSGKKAGDTKASGKNGGDTKADDNKAGDTKASGKNGGDTKADDNKAGDRKETQTAQTSGKDGAEQSGE